MGKKITDSLDPREQAMPKSAAKNSAEQGPLKKKQAATGSAEAFQVQKLAIEKQADKKKKVKQAAAGTADEKQVNISAREKQVDKKKERFQNKVSSQNEKNHQDGNRKENGKRAKGKNYSSDMTGAAKEAKSVASYNSSTRDFVSIPSTIQPSQILWESPAPYTWKSQSSLLTSAESNKSRECLTRFFEKAFTPMTSTSEILDDDLDYHEELLDTVVPATKEESLLQGVHVEEIRTTPLFTVNVLRAVAKAETTASSTILPQYSLIGKVLEYHNDQGSRQPCHTSENPPKDPEQNEKKETDSVSELEISSLTVRPPDTRVFLNINTPWSAFICGSQGSGKSHTLSCMLEAALQPSRLGPLVAPLAGMVFHYDKFTGFSSSQVCEAAYLCSTGIPVKILVSPSSFHRMKKVYESLPGVPECRGPLVMPLLLTEAQLNVERMMKLMAVEDDGRSALYMEVVCRILRSMALCNPDQPGLDYREFKRRLGLETFQPAQIALITMRLGLLESFMYQPDAAAESSTGKYKPYFGSTREGKQEERIWQEAQDRNHRAQLGNPTSWSSPPGTLTIVDLSCPFVDEPSACALFNISIALFLDDRTTNSTTTGKGSKAATTTPPTGGLILALDEAHKFLTPSTSSAAFTETLLSIIRQQRHLATRIVIATQEPTISPSLLDLCSMTIVHRFSSPEWLKALEGHLAGVMSGGAEEDTEEGVKKTKAKKKGWLMERIVKLEAGEGLVFCPGAMLEEKDEDVEGEESGREGLKMKKLGLGYLRVRVRKRVTTDGGRSILAA